MRWEASGTAMCWLVCEGPSQGELALVVVVYVATWSIKILLVVLRCTGSCCHLLHWVILALLVPVCVGIGSLGALG